VSGLGLTLLRELFKTSGSITRVREFSGERSPRAFFASCRPAKLKSNPARLKKRTTMNDLTHFKEGTPLLLVRSHFLFLFTLLCAGIASSQMVHAGTGLHSPAVIDSSWTPTGSMNLARYGHLATLLPSGQVLVAGGWAGTAGYTSSAELYDPTSGGWTATGDMHDARQYHTATLLPSGKVLVAGGGLATGGNYKSAELYDPSSGTWTATESMSTARYVHTATLLPSGEVLAAGGYSGVVFLNSADLYAPGFTLSARRRRVDGINTVRLTWSGADSTNIDVYRSAGPPIATVPNTGSYIDSTGDTGQAKYKYRVCEAGTSTCTNVARVSFPP